MPTQGDPKDRLLFVDGLRAVAILSVIGAHSGIPYMTGGFVGVDIFFVISGYLISTILIAQIRSGKFSAFDFYTRRILRILPPLLVVTIATVALSRFFPLVPREIRQLYESAAATAASVSNYYFMSSSDFNYFAVQAETQPLLHTWSLGVEEQYYLLAPWCLLAIILIAKRKGLSLPIALFCTTAAVVVLSFGLAAFLTHMSTKTNLVMFAYYSMPTRAWQFGVGGLVAILTMERELKRLEPLRRGLLLVAGYIGLCAILLAIASFDAQTIYPGFAALIPTLGTALVIAACKCNRASTMSLALSAGPFVAIGAVSYGWYLWHWPALAFMRSYSAGSDGYIAGIIVSALALGAATATYFLIEIPFRRIRRGEISIAVQRRTIAVGLVSSAIVAIIGISLPRVYDLNMGNDIKWATSAQSIQTADCQALKTGAVFPGEQPCAVGHGQRPELMFWGDSHAGQFKDMAKWVERDFGKSSMVFWQPSCPPVMRIQVQVRNSRSECSDRNDSIIKWLMSEQGMSIGTIVMLARWPFYNGKVTPSRGDVFVPRFASAGDQAQMPFAALLKSGTENLLDAIQGRANNILLIGSIPEFRVSIPECISRANFFNLDRDICAIGRASVEARRQEATAVLSSVASRSSKIRFIDPLDVFCDANRCRPFGDRVVYYSDTNHLTSIGARKLYEHLRGEFVQLLDR